MTQTEVIFCLDMCVLKFCLSGRLPDSKGKLGASLAASLI